MTEFIFLSNTLQVFGIKQHCLEICTGTRNKVATHWTKPVIIRKTMFKQSPNGFKISGYCNGEYFDEILFSKTTVKETSS